MAEEMGETLDQSQMRTGSRDQVSTNEGSPGGGAGGLLPLRLLQHPDVVLVQERHRGHPVGRARHRRRGVGRGEVPGEENINIAVWVWANDLFGIKDRMFLCHSQNQKVKVLIAASLKEQREKKLRLSLTLSSRVFSSPHMNRTTPQPFLCRHKCETKTEAESCKEKNRLHCSYLERSTQELCPPGGVSVILGPGSDRG